MFDFVNTTFSGLLSIIVTIVGLSCPLIIERIENIDKRYNSTLLAKRFMTEKTFRIFVLLMILNIITAIIFPFIIDFSTHARIWIAVQSSLVVFLLTSLMVLFSDMLIYLSPEKLSNHILENYYQVKGKDKIKEKSVFLQWVDVTPTLLTSNDHDLSQTVYDVLFDYVRTFYNDNDRCSFDDYFLGNYI